MELGKWLVKLEFCLLCRVGMFPHRTLTLSAGISPAVKSLHKQLLDSKSYYSKIQNTGDTGGWRDDSAVGVFTVLAEDGFGVQHPCQTSHTSGLGLQFHRI